MIAILALAAASLAHCPVEGAHYRLRHQSAVTAYFRDVDSSGGNSWPSNLALAVHNKASGRTYWWLPWNGGTDGLQNVASTIDVTVRGWTPPNPDGGPRPFSNRQYLGFTSTYDIIPQVRRRGDLAPAHMLFPDSAGSRDEPFPAKEFFDVVRCD